MSRQSRREAALLERDLKGRAWLWYRTLRQARKTVALNPSFLARTRVRFAAFGRIRQPVFILGCPRSGTTYLGELLEALPTCTYYFEPPFFKYFVRLMYECKASDRRSRRIYTLGLRALLLVAPGAGPRIVEKNPNHVFVADRLLTIFPDARFIVITRDGRDVTASLAEKPWHRRESVGSGAREPGGYLYGPYPHFYIEASRRAEYEATSDAHRCIWIWRGHQEVVEDLRTTLPPTAQHHLRYEDLVQRPTETLGALLDFLEVNEQDREPVFAAARAGRGDSVGRWKAALSDEDVEVMRSEAGALLAQLHYE